MLEIDSKTHKIKIESIDGKEGAEAYVEAMECELDRHIRASENAQGNAELAEGDTTWEQVWRVFWKSAETRHAEDIEQAQILIDKVKNKWGMD